MTLRFPIMNTEYKKNQHHTKQKKRAKTEEFDQNRNVFITSVEIKIIIH